MESTGVSESADKTSPFLIGQIETFRPPPASNHPPPLGARLKQVISSPESWSTTSLSPVMLQRVTQLSAQVAMAAPYARAPGTCCTLVTFPSCSTVHKCFSREIILPSEGASRSFA